MVKFLIACSLASLACAADEEDPEKIRQEFVRAMSGPNAESELIFTEGEHEITSAPKWKTSIFGSSARSGGPTLANWNRNNKYGWGGVNLFGNKVKRSNSRGSSGEQAESQTLVQSFSPTGQDSVASFVYEDGSHVSLSRLQKEQNGVFGDVMKRFIGTHRPPDEYLELSDMGRNRGEFGEVPPYFLPYATTNDVVTNTGQFIAWIFKHRFQLQEGGEINVPLVPLSQEKLQQIETASSHVQHKIVNQLVAAFGASDTMQDHSVDTPYGNTQLRHNDFYRKACKVFVQVACGVRRAMAEDGPILETAASWLRASERSGALHQGFFNLFLRSLNHVVPGFDGPVPVVKKLNMFIGQGVALNRQLGNAVHGCMQDITLDIIAISLARDILYQPVQLDIFAGCRPGAKRCLSQTYTSLFYEAWSHHQQRPDILYMLLDSFYVWSTHTNQNRYPGATDAMRTELSFALSRPRRNNLYRNVWGEKNFVNRISKRADRLDKAHWRRLDKANRALAGTAGTETVQMVTI